MKRLIFILGICAASVTLYAQKMLSIEECYTLAEQNYPLVKQRDLILKSKEFSIENVNRGHLPQLSINGQASYQSAVTQIPIKIPGNDVPTISKDQYKIYGEVTQTLIDGGTLRAQKQTVEANASLEDEKLTMELYKLKERINQLFFGILMLDEQLKQANIMRNDIQLGISKIDAAIVNGTVLKSASDVMQADLLRNEQRIVELSSSLHAYTEMLSLFLNQTVDDTMLLQKPSAIVVMPNINRHELLVFEQQKKLIDAQSAFINAKNKPKISLFFQGGYGRPALNFLNNDFTSYYIGGVRFTWSLSGFYTIRNEQSMLDVSRSSLTSQRETFLFNTNFILKQQSAEVAKLQQLAKTDSEIVILRSRIKKSALAQLENGVINSSDYLREVNAEDLAKQNQVLHELQLLMAQYNQQTTAGN